jgi:hypothetical protein
VLEACTVVFRVLLLCRRADFDAVFWRGFRRFELFLRFDRGGGTVDNLLLR